MKIAVTGYKGNVGSRLINLGCFPLGCDVTDAVEVERLITKVRPDVVIHCAGKSDVDWCERHMELTETINYRGAINVFSLTEKLSIPVVYISSDHIFSGDLWGNYTEASEDFSPKNHYGFTKFLVEATGLAFENVKVVRTSTLFWKSRTMIQRYMKLLEVGDRVNPPILLWRSFMHIDHFCNSLMEYAERFDKMPKLLHLSGSKNISWYTFIREWAKTINKEHLVSPRFRDVTLPGEAPRPKRAGLSTELSKSLGFTQYSYLDGIE